MEFVYNDGGRSKYFKGRAGDCVVRAISIAEDADYIDIYNLVNLLGKQEKITKRSGSRSSARDGVCKETTRKVMKIRGWRWKPLMSIGSGCTVHLAEDELPKGVIIVRLSGHVACVKNGVLHDTYDCTREGTRCVYGYWHK